MSGDGVTPSPATAGEAFGGSYCVSADVGVSDTPRMSRIVRPLKRIRTIEIKRVE